MAENVQETRPPEPPPKPPEVPKPTEQPNRAEAKDHGQPNESQQSAQQDARNAAQSEHAKATSGREPEGLQPTPEVQARPDEHIAAKNGPDGQRPTPEFQERLDTHPAAKAAEDAALGEAPRQDAGQPALDAGQPQDPDRVTQPPESSHNDEPAAGFLPDESAAARQPADQNTDAGDLARVGDGSGPWFDEGTNHREGGAVQQMTEGSCVSASGEMLTDGRITQPELLSELGDWSNLSALRDELNGRDGDGAWTGHYFGEGSEALRRASEGPMAAQVQAPFGRAHMVMLEPGENGSFTVRDPYEGSSYDVDSSWVEKYVAGGVFR